MFTNGKGKLFQDFKFCNGVVIFFPKSETFYFMNRLIGVGLFLGGSHVRKKVLTVLSLLFVIGVIGFSRFLDVDAIVAAKQGTAPSVSHDVPERANAVLGKTMDSESAFLVTSSENEGEFEDAAEVVAVISEPVVEAVSSENKREEASELPPSIELFGTIFERVTDEKFALYIQAANEVGAGFYAIPNSDVFAMVKDGEVWFQMSTGLKAVPVEKVELLVSILAKSGEFKGIGPIEEDIRKVASTGETISVEGPEYTGYSIFIQDGWILVSF